MTRTSHPPRLHQHRRGLPALVTTAVARLTVLSIGALAVAAAGCADTPGSGGQGATARAQEGPVGEAQSALLSGSTCVLGQACQSVQATVTIQRGGGVGNVFDSGINNNGVSSNAGSGTSGTIPIGDSGSPATPRQELMSFDLTPITNLGGAGYTIVEAQVSLYFCPSSTGQTIKVHPSTQSWGATTAQLSTYETTVSWPSYNESFVATAITSFGAGAANAFPGCVGSGHTPNNARFDISSLVGGWVNGTVPQDGILMEQPLVSGVSTIVLTSEYAPVLSGYHPTLFVEFNVSCATGTADCDNNGLNGCETNITTTQNCGACGHACPSTSHGTATCSAGACGLACAAGWTGASCATLVDNCAPNPCQNGGACTNGVDSYSCACAPGYTGTSCQTQIDNCAPHPCPSSYVCLNGVNSYTCQEPAGWTGTVSGSGAAAGASITVPTGALTATEPLGVAAAAPGSTPSPPAGTTDGPILAFTPHGVEFAEPVTIDVPLPVPAIGGKVLLTTDGVAPWQPVPGAHVKGADMEASVRHFSYFVAVAGNCSTNLCENGGACVLSTDLYTCACPAGFTGQLCEISADLASDCSQSYCQNGGTCVPGAVGSDYACACPAGYAGEFCEVTDCTFLASCQNGGTCGVSPTYQNVCTCPEPFVGAYCEIDADSVGCAIDYCQNGGTCNPAGFGYLCTCPAGWSGQFCEIPDCTSAPCQNGGTCAPGAGGANVCTCLAGWEGTNCEVPATCPCAGLSDWTSGTVPTQCDQTSPGNWQLVWGHIAHMISDSTQCSGSGTSFSVTSAESLTCTTLLQAQGSGFCTPCLQGCQLSCYADSSGPFVCTDYCTAAPCQNGATCASGAAGYTCTCPAGWVGTNCDAPDTCPCAGLPDWTSGTVPSQCDQQSGTWTLGWGHFRHMISEPTQCTDFTSGSVLPVTPFEYQLCTSLLEAQSSGVCTPCVQGTSCQIECDADAGGIFVCTDFCTPAPCQNGGTCASSYSGYTCACPLGYSGTDCEIADVVAGPDPTCATSLCQNGGTCVPSVDAYICACPPEYTGQLCDISADLASDCSENYCLNGGSCVPGAVGGTYTCSCAPGYAGQFCGVSDCVSQAPCQNGGTCGVSPTNQNVCACPEPYAGAYCEIDADSANPICATNYCQNGGTCGITFSSEYGCNCPAGWIGQFCETPDCTAVPCQNGGSCGFGVGAGFTCTCPEPFAGTFCEIDADTTSCALNFCQNGGTCNPAGFGYLCTCPAGWTGQFCETFVPCAVNPCLNGGSCYVHFGLQLCDCPAAYVGNVCQTTVASLCPGGCLNGGNCYIDVTGPLCSCPAGYTGASCEVPVDPCSPNPCQSGGTCADDGMGGYVCSCLPGSTGTICQFPDPCGVATMPDAIGAATVDPESATVDLMGFGCASFGPDGTPDFVIDVTVTGPLTGIVQQTFDANGNCIPGDGYEAGFASCSAFPAAMGCGGTSGGQYALGVSLDGGATLANNADNSLTPLGCGTHSLKLYLDGVNPGQQVLLSYQFADGTILTQSALLPETCPVGYVGANCQIPDPCLAAPCQNGGTCVGDGQGGYTCNCPAGYVGTNCQAPATCGGAALTNLELLDLPNGWVCTGNCGEYKLFVYDSANNLLDPAVGQGLGVPLVPGTYTYTLVGAGWDNNGGSDPTLAYLNVTTTAASFQVTTAALGSPVNLGGSSIQVTSFVSSESANTGVSPCSTDSDGANEALGTVTFLVTCP